MADKCGNCDCADRSQCVKGNQYGFAPVEGEMTYDDAMIMEAGENCPKCKCGAGCSCTNCTCCCN